MTIREKRQKKTEEFLAHNHKCCILRYATVLTATLLLIPASLAIIATGVDLQWIYKALAVTLGSCVFPVVLSVTWHRCTAAGVIAGALTGAAAGVVSWLVYASTLDGGLSEDFRANTSEARVTIVGSAAALFSGGVVCCLISLCSGGCSDELMREEVWEKTRSVDNPIQPWSVRYASDIGAQNMGKGRPHFYAVRRAFKAASLSAYIAGLLLAVLVVLVWPACMLLLDTFDEHSLANWTLLVLIATLAAAAYVTLVPVVWEVIRVCREVIHAGFQLLCYV